MVFQNHMFNIIKLDILVVSFIVHIK